MHNDLNGDVLDIFVNISEAKYKIHFYSSNNFSLYFGETLPQTNQ